jgi:hypothetical protein
MSQAFWISYGLLWVVVIGQLAVLVALFQHVGNTFMQSRQGRAAQGPQLRAPSPNALLVDLEDRQVETPARTPQAVFFASTNCVPCARLRDYLSRLRPTVEVIVICQGPEDLVRQWGASLPPQCHLVADPDGKLTISFGVGLTPFGFSIVDGVVQWKGLASEPPAIDRLLSPGRPSARASDSRSPLVGQASE